MDALLENERRSGNPDREGQLHSLQNLRSSINQSLTGRREVGESSLKREEQLNLAKLAAKLADLQPRINESHTQIPDEADVVNAVEGEPIDHLHTWEPSPTTISFVVKSLAEAIPEESLTPPEIARIESLVGDIDHQVPPPLPEWQQKIWEGLRHIFPNNPRFVTALVLAITLMATNLHEASAQSKLPTPTATIQSGENPLLNATPTPEPIDSSDQLNGEDAALVSESNQEEVKQEESAVVQSKLEVSPVIKSYRVLTDTLPLLSPYDATTVMADVEFKEGDSIQSATSMIINGEKFVAVKVVLTPDDTAPQADDDKSVDDELTAESNEEPEVKYVWVPKRNLEEKEQVTITKTVREAVILTAALNVRSGPGTNHAVVGSLKAGDRVEIVGEEDGWYIVNLEGVGQAYISADPNLAKQESKDVSVTTGQEINSNLEKYASTTNKDETSTGMGGKIEPDQLLALAVEKFPDSAVSIYIDSEKGPIALDTNGNELGRFENGKWKTMEEVNNFIINDTLQASQQDFENAKAANGEVNSVKIINNKLSGLNKYGLPISFYDGQKWENIPLKTYQELNASSQELEKNLIKTLPDNIAYVDSNNVLIIEKLSDEHKSTMNFSISGLGSYVSILTGEANQPSVTMRYLETAHRKEYLIDTDVDTPAIKMVIPASDYDKSVWETRTPEKQTQRLVNIKPGSIEESLKDPESTSTELIELTINLGLADYEKNQENIPYTDKLASCFWHMLENSEFVENGRLYFPSLNSSVKFGSQIIVVNGRNPDKKGIIGTYFDNNGVPVINGLPKNMLELTPLNGMFEPAPLNGSEQETQLVIFIADYLSRSRSRSLEVYGALALILQDEFGMTPNRVSGRMPVFENFMKQTATVSTNDNGEEIVVFPFSIYAAEQTDDPSIYGRVERVH